MNRNAHREAQIKLEKELSHLGEKLMASKGATVEETLKLASLYHTWSQVASQVCGGWAHENQVMSQMIVKGLEAGRPVTAVLERLSQAMTEASQNLEMEIAGIVMAAENQPSLDPADAVGSEDFTIGEDNLDGFNDFVTEAPEHLEAIERNLLSLSQEGKGDVLAVFRAFHTLKGISGFMGLTQLSALSHKAEAMLEPFKQGQGRPPRNNWIGFFGFATRFGNR